MLDKEEAGMRWWRERGPKGGILSYTRRERLMGKETVW